MLDLLDEGANLEFIDEVRSFSCVFLVSSVVLEYMLTCAVHANVESVPLRKLISRMSQVCVKACVSRHPMFVANRSRVLHLRPDQLQNGSTALIRAAHEGHTECVRLLLEAGAVKNTQNSVRVVVYRVSMCLLLFIFV